MPYKSKAQERYFNANRAKLERQGVDVDEWNKASKGMKLPTKTKKLKMPAAKKPKPASIALKKPGLKGMGLGKGIKGIGILG